ncbi:MAG: hypothetical protein EA399_09085 [Desulfovibrionales bacterium]|nr:MAG: hypothetical protein EA399_09085 [Desulfovibrionales bacterium]
MLRTMGTIYDIDITLLYDERGEIVTSFPKGPDLSDPSLYRSILDVSPEWNGMISMDTALLQEQYSEMDLDLAAPTVPAFHSSVLVLNDMGSISGRIVLIRLIPGNESLIQAISGLINAEVVYQDAMGRSVLSSFGGTDMQALAGGPIQVQERLYHVTQETLLDDKGEVVGSLLAALEEGPYREHRKKILLGSLGLLVLAAIFFGGVIYLLSSRVIGKIHLLSRALRRVTLETTDFGTRIPAPETTGGRAHDEVTTMIMDFNQMMVRLEDTYQQMILAREEVESMNRVLESRVRERTRELQDQVKVKEQALADLTAAQDTLLEMSRAAGMAEVATGVLHNVGNVLNSVNVSCTLLQDQLRQSRVGNVARVAEMLARPEGGLARFLTADPRGQKIPAYLATLASALEDEQTEMSREAEALRSRIEHIKEIVSMQQTYGRISGVHEVLHPEQLLEDALKLNAEVLARQEITVRREYEPVPRISVDKHKVLQILLNLIANARNACLEGKKAEKTIVLGLDHPAPDKVRLRVTDNGMGIAPENLTSIFQHGFTTRKDGHGFGLHSGALAARELGGSLAVHSDGPGLGATFSLELPCTTGEKT